MVFKPALCIVVQGAKWVVFGADRIRYRAGEGPVVCVEMPSFCTVTEASPSKPYLGMVIEFDLGIMREVSEKIQLRPNGKGETGKGVSLTKMTEPLAECLLRMVRLHETPQAIPVLYPAIMQELCYWLLTGPHGLNIMNMTLGRSHARDIVNAIHRLQERYAEPLRISDLAAVARLSESAFHRKFKAITSMTPLQYQKQLRLLEARRKMVSEESNAETAAFEVGYVSPSQFSREYSRMFGVSPKQDIASMRGSLV